MSARHASPGLVAAVVVVLLACSSHALRARPPRVAGTLRFSGGWTHVGPSGASGTSDGWLVYAFQAEAGDQVSAYVRSTAGAPAARLVDHEQRRLADSSVAHPDGDTLAVATATASTTDTYYLYVRDAGDPGASFELQLGGSFTCERDADCERAGEATGDPGKPSPLDIVPFCLFSRGEARGSCKGMTRESVEQLDPSRRRR